VPTIIISPFARRGYVDHTLYDTTSILKMIETRWNLAPLTDRDANANDLSNALDLGHPGVQTVAVQGFMQGHLPPSSSGRFAYVTFNYPGDKSVYTIDMTVGPGSVGIPDRAGFKVYGPQKGTVYLTGGAQVGLDPNVSGNLVGIDEGTYTVQIYNYSPDVPIDYALRITSHPPEGSQP
jgi:hypothetical protein